jgi:hypothetical protein
MLSEAVTVPRSNQPKYKSKYWAGINRGRIKGQPLYSTPSPSLTAGLLTIEGAEEKSGCRVKIIEGTKINIGRHRCIKERMIKR